MNAFESYKEYLLEQYSNMPKGYYVSLFIIRKTESETIFRTEGSGEELVKETVSAGLVDTSPIRRVVISKRKQTAVERRKGREFLNKHELLLRNKDGKLCMLNTNAPCEKCIDCYLYGFAAGGNGAQKSRVFTDDAYSLGSAAQIAARRTFNATFDNGTMRNPETGEASRSINKDEYVRPQAHFLDIETLKDVTLTELQYVIGNIIRSDRYGAISSRMGKIKNNILAVAFSDCELFNNLELTQEVYDLLKPENNEQGLYITPADISSLRMALTRFNGQTDSYYFRFDQNAIATTKDKAKATNFPQSGRIRMLGLGSKASFYLLDRHHLIAEGKGPRLLPYIRLGKFMSKAHIEWQKRITPQLVQSERVKVRGLLNAAQLSR